MSMYVYKWVSGLLIKIFSVGVKLVRLSMNNGHNKIHK